MYKILKFLRIIRDCPSCASAWTGGCLEPEKRRWCVTCGPGPIGRIWNWNFLAIRNAEKNAAHYYGIKETFFSERQNDQRKSRPDIG